jgi:transposase
MLSAPNFSLLDAKEKDVLILQLLARLEALERENAGLREKRNLPPKTPDNSSTPPSQNHKASGASGAKPKTKPHAGAHRPLHPNPTRCRAVPASQCQHCQADVSGVVQTPVHSYDRVEIPEIKPDVTRVTLLGVTSGVNFT